MQNGFGSLKLVGLVTFVALVASAFLPVLVQFRRDDGRTRARSELLDLKARFRAFHCRTGAWPGVGHSPWDGSSPFSGRIGVDALGLDLGESPACDPWGSSYRFRAFAPQDALGTEHATLLLYSPGPNRRLDSSAGELLKRTPIADDVVVVVTLRAGAGLESCAGSRRETISIRN